MKLTTALQFPVVLLTEIGEGQLTVGFSVSLTVTVKLQEEVLLDASVAVKTLVVVPTGNVEPLDKPVKFDVKLQLSEADTVKLTTALQFPGVLPTEIGIGQVTVGFSVSLTVTVKLHCAELLEGSIAVKTFVVVPTWNVEPLAKPLVNETVAEQLSVAVGVLKVATAPQVPGVLFILRGAGQAITGFWLSMTVTVTLQEEVFPDASVAVKKLSVVPIGNVEPLVKPAVCLIKAPSTSKIYLLSKKVEAATLFQVPDPVNISTYRSTPIVLGSPGDQLV